MVVLVAAVVSEFLVVALDVVSQNVEVEEALAFGLLERVVGEFVGV